MDELLQALRAAGEHTRLRILALCAERELTVTDLIHILGQTQSRVSRHLKIMVDAGLLERFQEGQWARYRIAGQGSGRPQRGATKSGVSVARYIMQNLDAMHPLLRRDREALNRHQAAKRSRVQQFIAEHAQSWESLRETYIDQAAVDAAVRAMLLSRPVRHLLEVGAGVGHGLEMLGPHVGAAIGIDISFPMLDLARARIEDAGLANCQVRHADMMALPYDDRTFDAVLFNMVLHYVEEPPLALDEAARVLAPGGQILIVDFAPHSVSELRTEHKHLWSGFERDRMLRWLEAAGFTEPHYETVGGDTLEIFALHALREKAAESQAA